MQPSFFEPWPLSSCKAMQQRKRDFPIAPGQCSASRNKNAKAKDRGQGDASNHIAEDKVMQATVLPQARPSQRITVQGPGQTNHPTLEAVMMQQQSFRVPWIILVVPCWPVLNQALQEARERPVAQPPLMSGMWLACFWSFLALLVNQWCKVWPT